MRKVHKEFEDFKRSDLGIKPKMYKTKLINRYMHFINKVLYKLYLFSKSNT